MDQDQKLARQRQAGLWLRRARTSHGFESAGELARALEVDPSVVSRYERGLGGVPDDRAEQIAKVLRLPVIEVRRGLGLWVPDDAAETDREPEELTAADVARQIAELADQLAKLPRRDDENDRRRKTG